MTGASTQAFFSSDSSIGEPNVGGVDFDSHVMPVELVSHHRGRARAHERVKYNTSSVACPATAVHVASKPSYGFLVLEPQSRCGTGIHLISATSSHV